MSSIEQGAVRSIDFGNGSVVTITVRGSHEVLRTPLDMLCDVVEGDIEPVLRQLTPEGHVHPALPREGDRVVFIRTHNEVRWAYEDQYLSTIDRIRERLSRKPPTVITIIWTTESPIVLFDNGQADKRFVIAVGDKSEGLMCYTEVWQRLSPQPGLMIQLADHTANTLTFPNVGRVVTTTADNGKFIACIKRSAYSRYFLYGSSLGHSWRLDLSSGEQITITDLRHENGKILYTERGVKSVQIADTIADYGTGEIPN